MDLKDYNHELVFYNINIELYDYIFHILTNHYKLNINKKFINIFIQNRISYNKYHIDQKLLNLFNAVPKNSGYKQIHKLLTSYNLILDEDFILINRRIFISSYAFKVCLYKNEQTKYLSRYFSILENICIQYHQYKRKLTANSNLDKIAQDYYLFFNARSVHDAFE